MDGGRGRATTRVPTHPNHLPRPYDTTLHVAPVYRRGERGADVGGEGPRGRPSVSLHRGFSLFELYCGLPAPTRFIVTKLIVTSAVHLIQGNVQWTAGVSHQKASLTGLSWKVMFQCSESTYCCTPVRAGSL
jgi:hypothetical protein